MTMDIRKKKKAWYRHYVYHIILGVCVVALIAYTVIALLSPQRLRVDRDKIEIAEVEEADFLEYVDVEGIVYPFMTTKINSLETGFVDRIVAQDGDILNQGDTILILKNVETLRSINDEEDEYERQRRLLREQEIEMTQKSLALQQQTLDVDFELSQLEDRQRIAKEEFEMGMKSKAEMDLAENEYKYHKRKTELQRRSLRHDSMSTALRREMLGADLMRAQTKRDRALRRKENLVVKAPVAGQLSFLTVSEGEQVQYGTCIGEIKSVNNFKIHVSLNEYYVDRISSGLPGSISQQGEQVSLKVSRVVPEIKDKKFEADLVFTAGQPANLRVGKSYRVQIELGQSEKANVIPCGDFYGVTRGKWIYKLTEDGKMAVKTKIAIGRQNPLQYEINSGLKAGDKVIIGGYERFDNKDEIIIQ